VRKGLPDLLAGFAAADLPGSELLLLGGGGEGLDGLLAQQPGSVRRLGHRPQDELVQHYGQAHCFLLVSIEEGFGMVLTQALACGLPLICSHNTGGEDLLRLSGAEGIPQVHGINGEGLDRDQATIHEFPAGWMVPIHAPQAIAHCLRRLAKEPGLWETKRQAALALAGSSLSWSAYGQRAIELYRCLLSDAQRPGPA
jgi:glycosyltransferase involved in cell wall biosynthesis